MKRTTSGLAIGAALVSCLLVAGCDLNVANEGDHDNVETEDSHDAVNGDSAITAEAAAATNSVEVTP